MEIPKTLREFAEYLRERERLGDFERKCCTHNHVCLVSASQWADRCADAAGEPDSREKSETVGGIILPERKHRK